MVKGYDAVTEHGIHYVSRLYSANDEYEMVVNDLDTMAEARKAFLAGKGSVTQYSIASRQLSRSTMKPNDFFKLWDALWAKKKRMEQGGSPRKAVGVVLRDW